MDLSTIWTIIAGLLAPVITIAVVRKGLNKALGAIVGSFGDLGHFPKLIIGLGISFAMIAIGRSGVVPGLEPDKLNFLFPLVSKAIYDLIHDLLKP